MAYSEPWHSQNSLFKHFQGYLEIMRYIDAYSATLSGALLKKDRDWLHLWLKFSIQNVVLILSWKKIQNVSLRGFFLVFLTKCLSNCSSSTKPPLPWKFLFVCLHSGIIRFAKRSILNVWQCSEYVPVSITACYIVQWSYAMYCIRHIQNSGIFRILFIIVN